MDYEKLPAELRRLNTSQEFLIKAQKQAMQLSQDNKTVVKIGDFHVRIESTDLFDLLGKEYDRLTEQLKPLVEADETLKRVAVGLLK